MALKLSVIFDGKNQKLKQATKDSEAALQGLQSTALRVTGVIAAAYSTATSARALLENQKMIDRWNAQMRVAAGGTAQAKAEMAELEVMAEELGLGINDLVNGFVRLSNYGLKNGEDALLAYMNTARAMGKTLPQYIEAVADASVLEFERLKEFGIKARNEGETIEFRFQGLTTTVKSSAEAIENYLIGIGQNELGGIVKGQVDQVESALNRMENQWIKTLQAINDGGIGDAMKATIEAGTEALGGFTTFIQEEGETIVDVGKAIAAVFAARVLGSVAAATHGFMLHQVAQARVIARYAAMNGITRSAATGLVAVGTAARFASAGMAMLGGPIGVIALAAYALYEWNNTADEAAEPTKSLADQVAELADNFERMTDAQRESARLKITARIAEIEKEIVAMEQLRQIRNELAKNDGERASLENFLGIDEGGLSGVGNAATHAQAKIDEMRAEVAKLQEKLEDLKKPAKDAGEGLDEAGDASEKAAKQFAKVTDKLAMQMVELALSEDSWERYQILQEAGTNLTEEQIATLDRLIARIRELRQAKEDELETERQRQAITSNIGSLSNQLMPQQSEMWQHRTNMSHIDQAIQNPSLAETMPGESEVEKLARLNSLKELEMQRHSEAMAQINGDMTMQIDAMWSETFDRFAAGIGDAVATSIMEGQNFGDMMKNLARSVIKTVISGLVEIGVKRLLLAGIEQSAAATTAAANIAAGTTTAVTLASVWTPAATMVSLATMGGNSAGAIAGMTAAMTAAQGLSLVGMAHDGIGRVPASHEGTWMLRKDEMVLNPEQRENFEFLVDHLKAQRPGNNAVAGGVGGSGAPRIEIFNEFKFEGGSGGNREEVEQAVTAANERFKAELIDDFSSGGRIYQTLKAKGG